MYQISISYDTPTATVTLTLPNGRTKAIRFVQGLFVDCATKQIADQAETEAICLLLKLCSENEAGTAIDPTPTPTAKPSAARIRKAEHQAQQATEEETEYNGWKNRQTWNVALWINNDEPLYRTAQAFIKQCKENNRAITYGRFLRYSGLSDQRTPDNISYSGIRLDFAALTAMLQEMAQG